MNDPSWFESWFNSPYYHLLYRDRDESEARPFIERLMRHLQLPPGARILDLACGKGRHSIVLADLGYEVLGIDIAPENIAQAKQFSRTGFSFDVHDMRQPLFAEPFDAVLNLFTSFGYFDTEQEHLAALETMARALKPTGKLVIDYLNIGLARAQLVENEARTIEEVKFDITRKIVANYLVKKTVVEDRKKNQSLAFEEKVSMFGENDFARMLAQVNVSIVEVWGDYLLSPYNPVESPRMILIGKPN